MLNVDDMYPPNFNSLYIYFNLFAIEQADT